MKRFALRMCLLARARKENRTSGTCFFVFARVIVKRQKHMHKILFHSLSPQVCVGDGAGVKKLSHIRDADLHRMFVLLSAEERKIIRGVMTIIMPSATSRAVCRADSNYLAPVPTHTCGAYCGRPKRATSLMHRVQKCENSTHFWHADQLISVDFRVVLGHF